MPSSPPESDDPIGSIRARLERGQHVDFALEAKRHPSKAKQILAFEAVWDLFSKRSFGDDERTRVLDSFVTMAGRPAAVAHSYEAGLKPDMELAKQYVLKRPIGRGGMGVVWLARDMALERNVAVKFLPEALLDDADAMRGLRSEANNMLALTHERIVRCHTLVRDDRYLFLVMEYLRGPTMQEVLTQRQEGRANGLQVQEVLWVLEQVAPALDFAHRHACLHLDLKPANLMLTEAPPDVLVGGKVGLKVTDFGVSFRAQSALSTDGRSSEDFRPRGTVKYMSPEVLRGGAPVPASDVYSLGVTLYQLVCGQTPFTSGDIVRQVLEESAPRLSSGSASFDEAIMSCLAKDPQKRPQSASAVLKAALQRPVLVASPAAPERVLEKFTGLFKTAEGDRPQGFDVLDPRAGRDGWARMVRDPRTGTQFVLVPSGVFQMGSRDEFGRPAEHPRHRVRIAKPFYMAQSPVTIREWRAFVEITRYSTQAERSGNGVTLSIDGRWGMHPKATWKNPFPKLTIDGGGDDHPVTVVSWLDTQEFCDKFRYRLPTEAEWEYACRAGTETAYWWGDEPARGQGRGNFADESFVQKFAVKEPEITDKKGPAFPFDDGWIYTSPANAFRPNSWDLHDMLGNVWEWCQDFFDPAYYEEKVEDGHLGLNGDMRVLRGGSFADRAEACRCAFRHRAPPDYGSARIGFRPVIEL